MLDDAGALGLGDLARPVGRGGVDDQDLVEQRDAADHLADRPPDDRPDRLLLVERRQDEADRQALLLLELDEPAQVGELGVVEVRFAEPAVDPGRDGPRLLGGPVGGREGLGPRGQLLERLAADRLARLDDDDRRLRRGSRPPRASRRTSGSTPSRRGRRGGGAHDDEVRPLRLAQDRVADVRGLADERLGAAVAACCRTNAWSARSAWARTASVIPGGTTWRTTSVAPWRRAIASAKRSASSACGPPRTGTTIRLTSRRRAA